MGRNASLLYLTYLGFNQAPKGFILSMHAVYRTDAPPGIAGRWFIDRLKEGSEAAAQTKSRGRRSTARRRS